MQKFIQAYIEKLDVTTIIENILTKVISLLLLLIVFYIAKKMLHTMVQRIVKPSLKCLVMMLDAKTISRLLENVFNYTLYFFLLYCILSILGLPVLVCWLELVLLGSDWYGEPKAFCLMSSMAFHPL